jgi:arabinan endo-1,5-alpha-L-arabinosidase
MTDIKNPGTHDPVLIKEGDRYYLFATGQGISILSSPDLITWKFEPPVFREAPAWAVERIPTFRGHIWAPDVQYYQGRYHVFYSCSAFGKNTSVIGHASSKTLNTESPDYGWTDHGMVIESKPYRDNWNAIDANVIVDEAGTPWMNFGSFWGGIKMVKLTADLTVAEPQEWYSLCRRPRTWALDDADPGDGAVEAPFIYKKGNYYYLFVSYDYCCRGERSDYKVMVGRSEKVTGPYVDKEGKRLDQNGGTILLQGGTEWAGVGHCGVHLIDNKDYFVAHAYVKAENGASKLIVRTLSWTDGWPEVQAAP